MHLLFIMSSLTISWEMWTRLSQTDPTVTCTFESSTQHTAHSTHHEMQVNLNLYSARILTPSPPPPPPPPTHTHPGEPFSPCIACMWRRLNQWLAIQLNLIMSLVGLGKILMFAPFPSNLIRPPRTPSIHLIPLIHQPAPTSSHSGIHTGFFVGGKMLDNILRTQERQSIYN